jgi:hypothetical protein
VKQARIFDVIESGPMVQKVTHPKAWVRTDNATQETNRHAVRASKHEKRWLFVAERRARNGSLAKTLGSFAAASEARAACEADFATLPVPPSAGDKFWRDTMPKAEPSKRRVRA